MSCLVTIVGQPLMFTYFQALPPRNIFRYASRIQDKTSDNLFIMKPVYFVRNKSPWLHLEGLMHAKPSCCSHIHTHTHTDVLEVNPLCFTVSRDRTHFYVCKCSLNTILKLWHKDNVCLCNKTAEPGVERQKFIVISIYDDTHQHKTHRDTVNIDLIRVQRKHISLRMDKGCTVFIFTFSCSKHQKKKKQSWGWYPDHFSAPPLTLAFLGAVEAAVEIAFARYYMAQYRKRRCMPACGVV